MKTTCPFENCEWEYEPLFDEPDRLDADFAAEEHYEREHAGRIQIQVTFEMEQLIGDRNPKEIRERMLERFEDKHIGDAAYVRTEVLEAADDHSKVDNE